MPPRHTRLSRRISADLRVIRGSTKVVEEQRGILDRQLAGGRGAADQLRDLRHATGQITRAANDAIRAYRRVSAALKEEAERADVDAAEVGRLTKEVAQARVEMLTALELASRRYPWAPPWASPPDTA